MVHILFRFQNDSVDLPAFLVLYLIHGCFGYDLFPPFMGLFHRIVLLDVLGVCGFGPGETVEKGKLIS